MTLAGLARETSTIRLGTLVSSATFRHPGPLAISVAQVDEMSGGRVELGLGAGWFEAEHRAYGLELPDVRSRFDRFEEQLAVVTGLWRTPLGETFSYAGKHYSVVDSPALPKPVTPGGPPIIVGGHGKRRTPRLAAQYAAEFNVGFSSVEVTQDLFARVDEACEAVGRPAGDLVRSVAHPVVCGRDEAQLRRRAAAIGRDLDELRADAIVGSPAACADAVGRYAAAGAGASRCYLQVLDLADLDHLDLIAAEVMPQV